MADDVPILSGVQTSVEKRVCVCALYIRRNMFADPVVFWVVTSRLYLYRTG